jgi:hypothetical protein
MESYEEIMKEIEGKRGKEDRDKERNRDRMFINYSRKKV